MSWFDLLKNIQISSQKTSSKDYVLPEEDEECKEWWLNLEDMLNALASKLHPENGDKAFYFDFVRSKSEDELCILRDDVTRRWSFSYYSKETLLRNVFRSNKSHFWISAYEIRPDYTCIISLSVSGPEDYYSEEILWKDLNEYPADYRTEIDAIGKQLKTGGLLLSFMDKTSDMARDMAREEEEK